MSASKFNVSSDLEKRTFDDIVFDSKMEMQYYRDVLCPGVESGEIINYELQKKYELLPGFVHNEKRVLPITYVCDFYIEYADGRKTVVDIKGVPDNVAKLKRKLFWHKYPDTDYVWLTNIKKFGGWINYDDAKNLRHKEKLEKNKREKENG